MKRISVFIAAVLLLTAAQVNARDPGIPIIPAPASMKKLSGEFVFDQSTVIKADNATDRVAVYLNDYLKNRLSFNSKVTTGAVPRKHTSVIITSKGAEKLSAEGYRLTITPTQVTIIGKDAGLFYGLQSLLQLFPLEKTTIIKLPCVEIEDQPRFGYRGMMLDVSRHFFTAEEVKKFIDLMAIYKLNYFHWHLVDNEGWRMEIKKYPRLTEVGGYRTTTMIGSNRDWFDKVPYGGFYTQEQVKDVVKYASDRFVTIIPEIEMPAHSIAALRAYPELKCEKPADSKNDRLYNYIYCPTEETFKFLEDILTEVIAIFPAQYIHIGGDEANKVPWKESVFCQNLMKELKLKDEHELQSYFIQRMEKFINTKGRTIIGWDEILEGGLAPNAIVMSWRGEDGGIAAAQQKHNVIMTPGTTGLYFDHAQSTSEMEPFNFGGYINNVATLEKAYRYNPVPASLTPEQQKYILGVQANIWGEFIGTQAKVEYMAYPRMQALAENAWTPLEKKNYKDFLENRLPHHLSYLDLHNINYRVPTAMKSIDTTMIGEEFTFELKAPFPGCRIYYSINGRVPGDTDWEYKEPLKFFVPPNEKRELQTLVITPAGRRSVVTRTILYNKTPLPATTPAKTEPGLSYKILKGTFASVELLETLHPIDSGITANLSTADFRKKNPTFGLILEGLIRVDADAPYTFSMYSDDGAQLFIDNELVIDNDKPCKFEKMGAIPLTRGYHKIRIKYFDKGAASSIKLFISGPGIERKEVNESMLFHTL